MNCGSRVFKWFVPFDLVITLRGVHPKAITQKAFSTQTLLTALFVIMKSRKHPKHPITVE